MSTTGYWQKTVERRFSRRRVIKGGAALASAALALGLAGCGDDDNDSSSSSSGGASESSLVAKPTDSTKNAKQGGVLKHFANGDPQHFDALLSANANVINFVAPFAYQRLLGWKLGTYPKAADGEVEGQIASSYEISPDKLTATFKLRDGITWDDRSPTNGRAVNPQDVLFSWNKFASVNQLASNLAYKADTAPDAPVESVTSPDNRTVVMKLHKPDSRLIALLCAYDYFNIMPSESESQFDPRRDVRGTGPWRLESFEPSVRLNWVRNPKFYIKDRPFPDRIEMPVIPDYTQQLAQFKAGQIYTSVVTPEDTAQTKMDVSATAIHEGPQFLTGGNGYITFGLEKGSPWHDVRLRQALSMAIDREAFANAIDNKDAFARQGLDLEVKRNSIVYAGWPGAYLDPTQSEFGPTSKYLSYNVEEAKKLAAAAGHSNGLTFDWVYSTERYGALYLKQVEVVAGMLPAAGLRPENKALPYTAYQDVYSEKTYWNFGGVVYRAGRGWPSLGTMFSALLLPGGSNYHGTMADGGDPGQGDPKLNAMIAKINQEFDVESQRSQIKDLAKYYTERSYSVMRPTNTKGFSVVWPAIGNYGLNSTYPGGAVTDPWLHWWIDSSKPPIV